jgi:hypothetical protein
LIFFFDRSVGRAIPEALRILRLRVQVEYHQLHFPADEQDDRWLPVVGAWGWLVIGQDYKYHRMPSELYALRRYSVGCFYLWGAQAPRWETMRVFAKAYDRIVDAAAATPRPFVYRVFRDGRLVSIPLP